MPKTPFPQRRNLSSRNQIRSTIESRLSKGYHNQITKEHESKISSILRTLQQKVPDGRLGQGDSVESRILIILNQHKILQEPIPQPLLIKACRIGKKHFETLSMKISNILPGTVNNQAHSLTAAATNSLSMSWRTHPTAEHGITKSVVGRNNKNSNNDAEQPTHTPQNSEKDSQSILQLLSIRLAAVVPEFSPTSVTESQQLLSSLQKYIRHTSSIHNKRGRLEDIQRNLHYYQLACFQMAVAQHHNHTSELEDIILQESSEVLGIHLNRQIYIGILKEVRQLKKDSRIGSSKSDKPKGSETTKEQIEMEDGWKEHDIPILDERFVTWKNQFLQDIVDRVRKENHDSAMPTENALHTAAMDLIQKSFPELIQGTKEPVSSAPIEHGL